MEKEDHSGYLLNEVLFTQAQVDTLLSHSPEVVTEAYFKYAKTIIQVGKTISPNVTEPIGLVAEIVPLTHPSEVTTRGTLDLRIMLHGVPLPDQPVRAGRETGAFNKTRDTVVVLRSNNEGIISLPITHPGVWWLHFIHLDPSNKMEDADYVSHWGSLTFETR